MRHLFSSTPAEISPALDSTSVLNPNSFVSAEELEGFAERIATTAVRRSGGTSPRDFIAILQNETESIEATETELTGTATGERLPVEDWLHDNLYVVREQMWAVRRDLTRGYYQSLPKLIDPPFTGLPRVYALACELTARAGGRIDFDVLQRFVQAYQRVTDLSIGELWALPSMLRAALLRHLAQLTKEVRDRRRQRAAAGRFVANYQRALDRASGPFHPEFHLPRTPSPTYIVQLIHDLRDLPPAAGDLWQELEERLGARDTRIDEITQQEHTREAFLQLAVSNLIGSMRRTSAIDWHNFVESVSRVDDVFRRDPAGAYGQMDFETRDDYRRAVEQVARQTGVTEVDVANHVLTLAARSTATDPRERHIGYYLVASGRPRLENAIGLRMSFVAVFRRSAGRHIAALYFSSLAALTGLVLATLVAYVLRHDDRWWIAAMAALVSLLPASAIAVTILHRLVTVTVVPRRLPRLDFSSGIPERDRTLIVVPTLLTSPEGVARQLHDLEVRSLANHGGATQFGLVTDFVDAASEHLADDDRLLQAAIDGIADLNERHGGARFVLLHRRRLWNPVEQRWMGWERKRGKLVELIAYLRSGRRGSFSVVVGSESQLRASRFLLTVDADTQLPAGAVQRLAGALAHPLNRPRLDPIDRRVVEGYGIIQPRVEIDLESAEATAFAHASSGGSAFDPYAKAVSDVYQDLFGEGNFVGKGILDIDAFEASLDGRIPENRLLSHDLFEGLFARTALCSDVHVVDEYPSHYLAWMARLHRWTRGDWQIARWLAATVPTASGGTARNVLPAHSRWKILDNLRRSLVPPALLVFLAFAWTLAPGSPGVWMLFALLAVGLPALFELADAALARLRGVSVGAYFAVQRPRIVGLGLRLSLAIAFLADEATALVDAIARTLHRLAVTHRGLLEWEPAAAAGRRLRAERQLTYLVMWRGLAVALALVALTLVAQPDRLRWALPVALLWMAAPELAYLTGRPRRHLDEQLLPVDQRYVRRAALRCWSFFDDFVTPNHHHLIPDNYQEDRDPPLASRTSPTNIGLQLLADIAASDFGYLTPTRVLDRVERVVETLETLPRYRGHFYNWYDTARLQPLKPEYISTVDSGNLAAHLLTVRQALVDIVENVPWFDRKFFDGLEDMAGVLTDEAGRQLPGNTGLARALAVFSERVANRPRTPSGWIWFLTELMDRHAEIDAAIADSGGEVVQWSQRLRSALVDRRSDLKSLGPAMAWFDRVAPGADPERLAELDAVWIPSAVKLPAWVVQRTTTLPADVGPEVAIALERLADEGRSICARVEHLNDRLLTIVLEMDFSFLYDERRGLFAIGYSAAENRLDGSFYDLLASEARLTSLLSIATEQVPIRHWFKLGRITVAPTPASRALLSWSGSMFEYMMPVIVTKLFPHTLLSQTCAAVIDSQIDYGRVRSVPWGFSEAAYALRDRAGNYQYKAFGAPGLGLKPGLAEELVVAPYASCLAALIRPAAAARNLRRLERLGVTGRYGYFESIDYTPGDSERGTEVVRTYMAHHVGMSLAAFDNAVHANVLQRRFHADARIRAVEQLLQEQLPLPGPVRMTPELSASAEGMRKVPTSVVRRYTTAHTMGPRSHLLSNGHYLVMLTNAGGGFSAVGETHVTRWREDPAQDCWGSFLYLRDVGPGGSGRFWSATFQPTRVEPDDYEVVFELSRARFRRRDGEIESILEVATGPDDAAEVRRLTLVNHGVTPRVIEVTSYAEITLTTAAADEAHPAFSNLFVRTEAPWPGALLAERRSREGAGSEFAIHVFAGSDLAGVEHETDRARFVGRGNTVAEPAVMRVTEPLSGTVGYVLDPVFSLRRRVTLGPRARVTMALATAHARSHEDALALVAKYREPVSIDHAFFLARSRTDIELREFNLSPMQALRFQRLASRLIHPDSRLRSATAIATNRQPIRELWKHGISGDLPILLVKVAEARDVDLVRELLTGHEYLRRRGYRADIVILNEHGASYRQELQEQLVRLCASGPWASYPDQPGGVFLRVAANMSDDDHRLLEAVARVICDGRVGSLEDQLRRAQRPPVLPPPFVATEAVIDAPAPSTPEDPSHRLQFSNGVGGFAPDGMSYEIVADKRGLPPAPWTNVIANPNFGCITTDRGLSCTWADNSQLRRLTPWPNDPVTDPASEALFVRDERTGDFWSVTPAPRPGNGPSRVRHGIGVTTYVARHGAIESTLEVFVPPEDRIKILTLELRHAESRTRDLSITYFADLQLGDRHAPASPLVSTEQDTETSALFARCRASDGFGNRLFFVAADRDNVHVTGDRIEFLGRNGRIEDPAALHRVGLSNRVGAAMDPCAAMSMAIAVPPGESVKLVFVMGDAQDESDARTLIRRYASPSAADAACQAVRSHWSGLLSRVSVQTPEPALDVLINAWLLYQTLACRIWGRSSFYQSSGAFGFRDQLQDVLALLPSDPSIARAHILRAAARQYREGDVQHWWHEPMGEGVRTKCSDDRLWLVYATLEYVGVTGDAAIFDESVPFLEGATMPSGASDVFERPRPTSDRAPLFEHCARAVDVSLDFGVHGLPLIGSSDWNDGYSHVGVEGKGESVWLGWFLADLLPRMSTLAAKRHDHARAERYHRVANELGKAIDRAWDGAWYRRAYFDDGTPLGSSGNDECRIDSIVQSWAVLSSAADPLRRQIAMDAVDRLLVDRRNGLVALLAPAFEHMVPRAGYIQAYPPGVRENGGQYTHAAAWVIAAFARLGESGTALELLRMVNPVLRASTPEGVARYQLEPYFVAGDVYAEPHAGRGGWSAYTGSSGWIYRVALEEILGLRFHGEAVTVAPRIPKEWRGFTVRLQRPEGTLVIEVENRPGDASQRAPSVEMDGAPVADGRLPLSLKGEHRARVVLEQATPAPRHESQIT